MVAIDNVKAGLELIGNVIQNPRANDADVKGAGEAALNLLGEFMLSQFRCEELLQQIATLLQQEQNARLGR